LVSPSFTTKFTISYINLIKTKQKNKQMKKVIAIFAIAALTACGGKGTSTEATTDSTAVAVDSTATTTDSTSVAADTTATK
jgi:uncharacterized lipoprotein YajG